MKPQLLTPERERELREMELVNEWTSADEDAIWATLDASRKRTRELEERLLRLANEAHGFLSLADRETHGVANMNVLRLRIDEARAALARENT